MKANQQKQMYLLLKQQQQSLQNQLAPAEAERINEIPENFNQIGWDITVEKVEIMLTKMKELSETAKAKNRLTPQFYRTIYNRALIAVSEINKMLDSLMDVDSINYEAEIIRLNAEIYALNIQVAEAQKVAEEAAAKAAQEAEEAAKKEAEEVAKAAKEAEKASGKVK